MLGDGPDYGLLDEGGLSAGIFFPRSDPMPPPAGAVDHLIEVSEGVQLGARLYPLAGADAADRPSILYFHGNGEVASDHDGIAPLYHSIGVNLLVIEFRGYGRSTGTPTIATLIADGLTAATSAHELLDEAGLTGRRYVMGRSLGANPALEIAARADGFSGLVLESGAGNIGRLVARFGLDGRPGMNELIERHEAKLASITIPTLIIHGMRDDLVPVETAIQTEALLTASEVEMHLVPDAGHNDLLLVDPGGYFESIDRFVDHHR